MPLFFLCFFLVTKFVDPAFYNKWVESEQGLLEWGVPLVLLPGIYLGIRSLKLAHSTMKPANLAWFYCVIAGSIYLAGEELSWGQHLFFWETPETLRGINDQNETNLHNISSWFDQKPRMLLELWVLFGGVILPVGRLLNKTEYETGSGRYWFWPETLCLPSAVIAVLIKMPERIKDVFGLDPFRYELRWSEVQEFYFALFLCLYLGSVYVRLNRPATITT